jgi:uncharacterized protein (TIGR00730 family)
VLSAIEPGSPADSLAVEDTAILLRDEMKGIRFALEYSKADLCLRDWRIRSTIIVFGSARILPPEAAQPQIDAARRHDDLHALERLERRQRWYAAARDFGRIASERGGALVSSDGWRDNVIATGGGPGLMEAANRGACEAGAPTIGFNIRLPTEQRPNPYTTPALTFRFHYFAMRKMHLAMRANALAIFPGGFGTMDELFEILTLRQTNKAPPIPIVLFDREYWRRMVDFDALAAEDMAERGDLELFEYAESAEECWNSMVRRGLRTQTPESNRTAP